MCNEDHLDLQDDDAAALQRETFCILPWTHVFTTDAGWVYPCCLAQRVQGSDGSLPTLFAHTVDELRNSPFMVRLRQEMLAARRSKVCAFCYQQEDDVVLGGGSSERIFHTKQYLEANRVTFATVKAKALAGNGHVDEAPATFHLSLSNTCNLACRMCNAANSSKIESDPIHARWAPAEWILRWSDDVASIRGSMQTDMRLSGVSSPGGGIDRIGLLGATACIEFPMFSSVFIEYVDVIIGAGREDWQGTVSVCGSVMATIGGAGQPERVRIVVGRDVPPGLFSISFQAAQGNMGTLELLGIDIRRQRTTTSRQRVVTRLPDPSKGWSDHDEVLFGELITDIHRVRRLNVVGGEPMLHKQYLKILHHLVASGHSGNVTLALNTNCTVTSDEIVDLFKQFRRVEMNLSIDDIEDGYEYIRYPASWQKVAANVLAYKNMLENAVFLAVPVVQAYNCLRLGRLARWFDGNGIAYSFSPLTMPPHFSLSVLPEAARQEAAKRLRQYAENIDGNAASPEESATMCRSIADIVEHQRYAHCPKRLGYFVKVTNDLDRSRGQRFADVHAELLDFHQKDGFIWDEADYRFYV